MICALCHGQNGEGATRDVTRLAGQNAGYLSHALSMFKAGARDGVMMQNIARSLSDAEIIQLADYFSKQNTPLVDAAVFVPPQRLLAGKRIAETGVATVPACFGCHAADGKGQGARFPAIAGQTAKWVQDRRAAGPRVPRCRVRLSSSQGLVIAPPAGGERDE